MAFLTLQHPIFTVRRVDTEAGVRWRVARHAAPLADCLSALEAMSAAETVYGAPLSWHQGAGASFIAVGTATDTSVAVTALEHQWPVLDSGRRSA